MFVQSFGCRCQATSAATTGLTFPSPCLQPQGRQYSASLTVRVTPGPAFAGARLFPAAADQVQERQRLPRPLAWDSGTEE
jgi:hypothetical protein